MGQELIDYALRLHWFLGTWYQFSDGKCPSPCPSPPWGEGISIKRWQTITNCTQIRESWVILMILSWPSTWTTSRSVLRPVAAPTCGFCLLQHPDLGSVFSTRLETEMKSASDVCFSALTVPVTLSFFLTLRMLPSCAFPYKCRDSPPMQTRNW